MRVSDALLLPWLNTVGAGESFPFGDFLVTCVREAQNLVVLR